jgi:hypothetical protein
MVETIWKFPVPATYIERSTFTPRLPRNCELLLETDEELGIRQLFSIVFQEVQAYRCTYAASKTPEMVDLAYGQIVSLGRTAWLTEVQNAYGDYQRISGEKPVSLQHIMVCLDDGPCYEVICSGISLPEPIQGDHAPAGSRI